MSDNARDCPIGADDDLTRSAAAVFCDLHADAASRTQPGLREAYIEAMVHEVQRHQQEAMP